MASSKTVIVTGASQGIGAGVVQAFLERGYNVVANSRNITNSGAFRSSAKLVLVDGNIGDAAVAARVVATAIEKFGSIDAVVNNAGIFFTKPFTEYTAEDFKALSSVNLEGFLYVTQGSVRQMLAQKSGGRADDYQRRPGCGDPQSGERVCEGAYPLQCCRPGNRGYADAREESERLSQDALAHGHHLQRERYRERGCLSDRGRQCDR